MELMERLRKAGFEIRLVEDSEDNLMRVCSKDIAAELLEMTFGSEVKIQEW